jgi:hypothetical protein
MMGEPQTQVRELTTIDATTSENAAERKPLLMFNVLSVKMLSATCS